MNGRACSGMNLSSSIDRVIIIPGPESGLIRVFVTVHDATAGNEASRTSKQELRQRREIFMADSEAGFGSPL